MTEDNKTSVHEKTVTLFVAVALVVIFIKILFF